MINNSSNFWLRCIARLSQIYTNNFHQVNSVAPICSLASVKEIHSKRFKKYMSEINDFALSYGLRQFTNWSKVWEYPWLWHNALSKINWRNLNVVDLGSEISPMPWYLASKGANVTLIEFDSQWEAVWTAIKKQSKLNVDWHFVTSDKIPCSDSSVDVLTSFSVIEHQSDKIEAIHEVIRVLKPGGKFAMSFDICEPEMGMTFPEWNGCALSMAEFESYVWNNKRFNGAGLIEWNVDDIPNFIEWHLKSAPYHNYVVGACCLTKR